MTTKTILGISLATVFTVSMIVAQSAIADGHAHFTIEKSEYEVKDSVGKLEIKVAGDIPTDGTAGAFGYGVITGVSAAGPENVLALTTHMCAADHPLQGADGDCEDGTIGVLTQLTGGDLINEEHDGAEMHAHILDLKANAVTPAEDDTECGDVEGNIGLEVDIARTLEGLGLPVGDPIPEDPDFPNNNLLAGSEDEGYDIKVDDAELTVTDIPAEDLFGTEAVAIVSFGIVPLTENSDDDTFITNLCLTDGSTNPLP